MSKADNLVDFNPWEKMGLEMFTKKGCDTVRMVTEFNSYYGELVTAFQIGEEQHDTGVDNKYIPGHTIILQESNSLCGVREFEKKSITYEFLWKPLGLDPSLVKRRPYLGGSEAFWTHFYSISNALRKIGYERSE